MFALFVVLPAVGVGDGLDDVVDEVVENGGEVEGLGGIDVGVVDVVELGEVHAGDHFGGGVVFVHALLHAFLDVDFNFLVDEVGPCRPVLFEDLGECFGQAVGDGGGYVEEAVVYFVAYEEEDVDGIPPVEVVFVEDGFEGEALLEKDVAGDFFHAGEVLVDFLAGETEFRKIFVSEVNTVFVDVVTQFFDELCLFFVHGGCGLFSGGKYTKELRNGNGEGWILWYCGYFCGRVNL